MATLSYEEEGTEVTLHFDETSFTDVQGIIEKMQERLEYLTDGEGVQEEVQEESDPSGITSWADAGIEISVPTPQGTFPKVMEYGVLPPVPGLAKVAPEFAPPHPMSFGDWLQTQPEWGKTEAATPTPPPDPFTKSDMDKMFNKIQNGLGIPKSFMEAAPYALVEQKLISNLEISLKVSDVEPVSVPFKGLVSYETTPQVPKSTAVAHKFGSPDDLSIAMEKLVDKIQKKDSINKASLLSVITQQLGKVLMQNPEWASKIPGYKIKGPKYEIPFTKVSSQSFKKDSSISASYKMDEPSQPQPEPMFSFPIPTVPLPGRLGGSRMAEAIKRFGTKAELTAVLQEVDMEDWKHLNPQIVTGVQLNKWLAGVDVNTATWGTYAVIRKKQLETGQIESHRDRAARYQSLLTSALGAIETLLKVKHGQILAFNQIAKMANDAWKKGQEDASTLEWICEEEKKGCIQWGPPRVTIDAVKLPDGRVVDLS